MTPSSCPHRDGHLADTACWRRCHASIKSRQTSPTGDERQNKRKSGPARPTASKRVSSPPVGTFSPASDVTNTRRSKQQASKGERGRRALGVLLILRSGAEALGALRRRVPAHPERL